MDTYAVESMLWRSMKKIYNYHRVCYKFKRTEMKIFRYLYFHLTATLCTITKSQKKYLLTDKGCGKFGICRQKEIPSLPFVIYTYVKSIMVTKQTGYGKKYYVTAQSAF